MSLLLSYTASQAPAVSDQFVMLLGRSLLFYGLHFAVLAAGLWFLGQNQYRERVERIGQTLPVVLLVALGCLVFAISEPQREWFGDFVEAYYAGGAAALQGLSEVPKAFDRGVHGFVNIPVLALPFVPFALMSKSVAAGVYLVLGLAAVIATWRQLVVGLRLDRRGELLCALLLVLNGPLQNSLREGNTSHFALYAMTAAYFHLRARRDMAAGLLIGAAALFKLPLLLFGAYFLIRGRLRAVVGSGLVVGGAALASVLLFGIAPHVQWYESFVASASERPIGAFNVQSFSATMLRFERAGEVICDWGNFDLPTAGRWLSRLIPLTLVGAVAAAAALPRWRHVDSPATADTATTDTTTADTGIGQGLEYLCVLVLACVTSPLAWSHYYCWMLLPLIVLMSSTEVPQLTGRARTWVWLAVVLTSAPVLRPWCSPSGIAKYPYLIVLSHYLIGGVLCLALLALYRYKQGMARA